LSSDELATFMTVLSQIVANLESTASHAPTPT